MLQAECLPDNGSLMLKMGSEYYTSKEATSMLASFKMTSEKDMAFTNGAMEEDSKVGGMIINNTD